MKNAWLLGLLVVGLIAGIAVGAFLLASPVSSEPTSQDESSCVIPPEALDLWNAPMGDEILAEVLELDFRNFVTRSYELYLLRHPQAITTFGLASQLDVRNDGLDNYSMPFLRETQRIERRLLDQLWSYNRESLGEEDQFLYDVCEAYWTSKISGHAFEDNDYLVTNVYGGSPDWILYDMLTTYHPRETLTDIEDYMTRLSQVETLIDQLIDGLEDRKRRGIIAPPIVLAKARELLTSMAYVPIEKHPLFASLALMVIANPNLCTSAHPKYLVPTQTFHETYPGMHLYFETLYQAVLPLIQQTGISGSHVLGWAAYAERLAWELGAYKDDTYGNLGRLHEELKRAVLVAVDTGMHALGWTYEETADFYRSHTADSEDDIEMNVLQAIAHPASFVPAFTGFYKLLALRQGAQAALGDGFQLVGFHHVVLNHGSLPMHLVERVVENYIAQELAESGN